MPKRKWIPWMGERYTVTELAALAGMNRQTLASRLARGMPLENAMGMRVMGHQERGARGCRRSPWSRG